MQKRLLPLACLANLAAWSGKVHLAGRKREAVKRSISSDLREAVWEIWWQIEGMGGLVGAVIQCDDWRFSKQLLRQLFGLENNHLKGNLFKKGRVRFLLFPASITIILQRDGEKKRKSSLDPFLRRFPFLCQSKIVKAVSLTVLKNHKELCETN